MNNKMKEVNIEQLKAQELHRFVMYKNQMDSDVQVGKTLFNVSSFLSGDGNSFKDVVSRIAQRQVEKINNDAV